MSCEYGRPNHESKPCAIGRNCGQVAEVPLADHAGRVAARLQQLGERDLVERQALGRAVAQHLRRRAAGDAVHAAADRQPAGQQRRPARRAHRLDVEAGPLLPRRRHRVEARRAVVRAAEGAEIAVAQVVGEDDDDVRRRAPPAIGAASTARIDATRPTAIPDATSGFSMRASGRRTGLLRGHRLDFELPARNRAGGSRHRRRRGVHVHARTSARTVVQAARHRALPRRGCRRR